MNSRERGIKIGEIVKDWKAELQGWPVEEWGDDVWEGIEESICGIYFEEWRDLLDWEHIVDEEAEK